MVRCSRFVRRFKAHAISGRARDESLGPAERADAPESQGLFQRLREGVWRVRRIAVTGRADHFRLRRAMSTASSRRRLEGQLDQVYHQARKYMEDWTVGDVFSATSMCRRMINAQISSLSVSVDSQDIIDDLMTYKERTLLTHIVKAMPKFMLSAPGMKRRARAVDTLLERVQGVHTPAQRAGAPRDLADDILSLHVRRVRIRPRQSQQHV